jgi:hypothetical protein
LKLNCSGNYYFIFKSGSNLNIKFLKLKNEFYLIDKTNNNK